LHYSDSEKTDPLEVAQAVKLAQPGQMSASPNSRRSDELKTAKQLLWRALSSTVG
jgi:hypothetical protein